MPLFKEPYLKYQEYIEAIIGFKLRCAKGLLIYFEKGKIFTLYSMNNKLIGDYFASNHFSHRIQVGVKAEMLRVKQFIKYLEED